MITLICPNTSPDQPYNLHPNSGGSSFMQTLSKVAMFSLGGIALLTSIPSAGSTPNPSLSSQSENYWFSITNTKFTDGPFNTHQALDLTQDINNHMKEQLNAIAGGGSSLLESLQEDNRKLDESNNLINEQIKRQENESFTRTKVDSISKLLCICATTTVTIVGIREIVSFFRSLCCSPKYDSCREGKDNALFKDVSEIYKMNETKISTLAQDNPSKNKLLAQNKKFADLLRLEDGPTEVIRL